MDKKRIRPTIERGGLPKNIVARGDTGSKRLIFRRTAFLMFICGFFMFIPLIFQLWSLAIVKHEEYGKLAANQQTKTVSVSANRGNIYDSSGNTLAMSATVYKLILSPLDLIAKINKSDFYDTNKDSPTEGQFIQADYDTALYDRKLALAHGIIAILPDLTVEEILLRMEKTHSQYEILASDIEEDTAELIRDLLEENKCGYDLWLTPDSKRYYPYSTLACGILGFVNNNGGAYGVEAYCENYLCGQEGRVVTAKTGRGTEMYNSFSSYEDAVNGYNINLTIDATIQSYAEKALAEGIVAYDVQDGGFCIVMDPNTGQILAAASSPTYDLNNYAEVIDPQLQEFVISETAKIVSSTPASADKTYDEIVADAKSQATATARETMWRSLTFQDTYEPGSTFKAIVLAAALEENLVDESDMFMCTGSVTLGPDTIRCSDRNGHGMQTLAQAVQNSCNPAFIEIGERLGIDLYYKYFEGFGMKDSTNIDLNGEYLGIMWAQDAMTMTDLAVGSFGQRFTVNPLQMITGLAATINGGYLYQPYLIDSITDEKGTVIEATQPTMVRQVVSQETSKRTQAILETVVAEGSGKNARVAGYDIGGKTGTSQTLVEGLYTVSFMGFAPANDPQVIVLLAFKTPTPSYTGSIYSTTGVYISGGNMAAPKGGQLIAETLNYLGVKREYSQEELAMADITVPKVTDFSLEEGIEILTGKTLNYRTVGEGDTITAQVPARGAVISGNSTVILYLGESIPETASNVPNISGLSYADAKYVLEERGFFLATDTYLDSTSTVVEQSLRAGEIAALGTVIDVIFTTPIVSDGAGGY